MEIKRLNAARGWIWIKHGYQLGMRNPLMAVSFALICALGLFAALHVPLFGPLVAVLLMPVLMAGYMRFCRALEEEEEAELPLLFAGFKKHTARLVSLGGFVMLGLLGASTAMVVIGGDALTTMLDSFKTANDPQLLVEAMWTAGSGVAFSLLVGFTLVFVLMLALQYAPMLIFFHDATPVDALRASLLGSLRNFVPYTVYSILMQLLALVLGLLPFGIGLIVLLPMGLTSLYVSYRNIFPFAHELAAIDQPATTPEA
ncbi:MAG TPA: BPSS1780 family membrane protein [Sideroxyarcus sp.]|nr:BPSS1780 family membrane protein [Sideroxyarcus sp.]